MGFACLSPFSYRFGWRKGITWNGLNITATVDCFGESWWEEGLLPVRRTSAPARSDAVRLKPYVTGSVMATYGIWKGRVRFSIAARNIGMRHYEMPLGSIVGPLILTSMRVRLGK